MIDDVLEHFKRFVLQTLKPTGACSVRVTYTGCGTEAEIHDIDFFGPGDTSFPFPDTTPGTLAATDDDPPRTWPNLSDMLFDFTKDVVATYHEGDEPEGSSGTLSIDIENDYVTLERNQAVITTDTTEI